MGQDVVRLLDALGVAKAHVVGYSMGAQLVAQLVTSNPQRFLTAVLGGASGRWRWTAEDQQLTDVEASEIEQRMLRSMLLRVAPTGTRPTDDDIRKDLNVDWRGWIRLRWQRFGAR
jgi:pimeloyl-ACP methyl ester carboxylesterase